MANSAKNTLAARAAAGLELPQDIIKGAARVELLGQEHLRVVNHGGIIVYQQERIVLRLREGVLRIQGSSLIMTELDDEQLIVEGRVDGLAFAEAADEE